MKFSINYRIAQVYLTSNLKQTVVAMLGVVFGISMYIFMTNFILGVNNKQSDLIFTSLAHIRIYNDKPDDHTNLIATKFPTSIIHIRNAKIIKYTDGIKNSIDIIRLLKTQKEINNITTQVNISVFFTNGGVKINGVISGVDVENENKVFKINDYIKEGNWFNLKQRSDGLIIGSELAYSLNVKMDDNVNVQTSNGIIRNFKVIGIFKTEVANIDRSKAYLNISTARQLIAKNKDYVTDIQMNIKDYEKTAYLVKKNIHLIPFKIESWQVSNQQLFAGAKLRDIVGFAVSMVILLVAGFGIYNIINMTINHKIKEIAILKAMGFTGKDVTQIFLTQSIVIGILGGILGLGLGFLISYIVDNTKFEIAGIENLPMSYLPKTYMLAFTFGLLTTIIAGYIPAKKAAKIDPVKIIKG